MNENVYIIYSNKKIKYDNINIETVPRNHKAREATNVIKLIALDGKVQLGTY